MPYLKGPIFLFQTIVDCGLPVWVTALEFCESGKTPCQFANCQRNSLSRTSIKPIPGKILKEQVNKL